MTTMTKPEFMNLKSVQLVRFPFDCNVKKKMTMTIPRAARSITSLPEVRSDEETNFTVATAVSAHFIKINYRRKRVSRGYLDSQRPRVRILSNTFGRRSKVLSWFLDASVTSFFFQNLKTKVFFHICHQGVSGTLQKPRIEVQSISYISLKV